MSWNSPEDSATTGCMLISCRDQAGACNRWEILRLVIHVMNWSFFAFFMILYVLLCNTTRNLLHSTDIKSIKGDLQFFSQPGSRAQNQHCIEWCWMMNVHNFSIMNHVHCVFDHFKLIFKLNHNIHNIIFTLSFFKMFLVTSTLFLTWWVPA